MKISISMEHPIRIDKVSPAQSAEMLKNAGFQGVDISMTIDMMDTEKVFSPEWRERILGRAAAAKAAGLEIAQCHLPYYPNHIPYPGEGKYEDFEAFMLPRYELGLAICAEIGCPVGVTHPYSNVSSAADTHEGNLRMLEKLIPLLEKYNVKLALENLWAKEYKWSHVSSANEILSIINECGSPMVGACIDTGHANIFSLNISDMARTYGDRLFALHVNGNAGKDEHTIPYAMSGWCELIDFNKFTRTLHEIGFKGFFNLELSTGGLPKGTAQPFINFAASVASALIRDNS